MTDDLQIGGLNARRSYEFRQDDLLLTQLVTQQAVAVIYELFAFNSVRIERPFQVFGPVPTTMPPGLVFEMGTAPAPPHAVVPIRYICIDARRIVIDVVGPSEAIDATFAALQEALKEFRDTRGKLAVGTPLRVLDASDLSVPLGERIDWLVPSQLLEFANATAPAAPGKRVVPVEVRLSVRTTDEEAGGRWDDLLIGLRAGAPIAEGLVVSSAPLDTAAHEVALLRLLRSVLPA